MSEMTFLQELQLGRIDFVDRPAQAHSRIAIFKRDDQEHTVPKLEDLPEEVQKSVAPVIEELEAEKVRLEQELEELRNAAEGNPSDEDEDVTKRDDLPEDVRAAITKRDTELEELREQVRKSEERAETERRERRVKDWRDRIAKFDALNLDQDEYAERMVKVEDANSELAADVAKMFETIDARINELDQQLFEPIGKGYDAEPTSGEEKLEKIAKGLREDSPELTEAKAMALAVERHPELTREA